MRILLSILMLSMILVVEVSGQLVISPYSYSRSSTKKDSTTGSGLNKFREHRFIPFRDKNQLQSFYDTSNVLNTLDRVSFSSLLNTSVENPSSFVEIASYVDPASRFRTSLSVQLTNIEIGDSLNEAENIAIQKLLNRGGNISVGFTRPIFYDELEVMPGSYMLCDLGLNFFFDLPFVNRRIYNPSIGTQLFLEGDIRIFTDGINSKSRSRGKLFRFGFEYTATWNVFNQAFRENTTIGALPGSTKFLTIEPYLGLVFFNIKFTRIFSSDEIFRNSKSILEVNIVPIKF